MAFAGDIDQAVNRYMVLDKLLKLERSRAASDPTAQRYKDIGITKVGDTKKEAETKIRQTFDDLSQMLEHNAILDAAAAFEYLFRKKLQPAIEARAAIKGSKGKSKLLRGELLKSLDELQGLASISSFLSTSLSAEVAAALSLVRESRNAFAHGTDISVPPKIQVEEAREALLAAAAFF